MKNAAQSAVMRALRHALKCIDIDCAECAFWRDTLDGGAPALLAAGDAVVAEAERGKTVERAARNVVRSVAQARERPSHSTRLDEVENDLRALAKLLDEDLPRPRFTRSR